MIYKVTNSKVKGTKKWGNKKLNFFTLHESIIDFDKVDENGDTVKSGQSLVAFRLHSSKAFAEKDIPFHIGKHGGIHVRYWIYDGTDKTEQELIDWAIGTEGLIANDEKTIIHKAKKQ